MEVLLPDSHLEPIDIPPSFEYMPEPELERMLTGSFDPNGLQQSSRSDAPESQSIPASDCRQLDTGSSPSVAGAQLTPSSSYSWLPSQGDGSYGGNEDDSDMNNFDSSPSSNISPTATNDLAEFVLVERPKPDFSNLMGAGPQLSHLSRPPLSSHSVDPAPGTHSSRAASLAPTHGDAGSYRDSFHINTASWMDSQFPSSQGSSFMQTAHEEPDDIGPYAPHDLSTNPFASVGTTFNPGFSNAALSFGQNQQRMVALAQHSSHLGAGSTQPWQPPPIHTSYLPMQQWPSHTQELTAQLLFAQQLQHESAYNLHGHVHRSPPWQPPFNTNAIPNTPYHVPNTTVQPDPQEATISPASIAVPRIQPEQIVTSQLASASTSVSAPTAAQTPITPAKSKAPRRPSRARPIAPGDSSHLTAARAAETTTGRKGGRKKGSHLAETARRQAHNQRKIGACWGCALQRDPVRSVSTSSHSDTNQSTVC